MPGSAITIEPFGLELTLVKLLSGGRYRPEPWQPADSLVWAKLMALSLDGNWRGELLRLRMLRLLGEDNLKFLMDRPSEKAATPRCRSSTRR